MIDLLTSAGDVWLAILFVLAGLALFFLVKKNNLGAFLISVYVSFVIVAKSFFEFLEEPIWKTAFFFILVILLFSSFRRSFRIEFTSGRALIKWSKIILFLFSLVGLLSSLIINWLPQKTTVEFFSPTSLRFFQSAQAQLFWIILPLILIFIFKRRA